MDSSVTILFLTINLVGFLLVLYDKHQAKAGKWRVAEKRFFTIGFIGGAIGILIAMKLVRHKTKHRPFTIGMPLLVIVNLILYYYIAGNEVDLWLKMR